MWRWPYSVTVISGALAMLLACNGATASAQQSTSGAVDIDTLYSQNGQFYLRTVPYDNEFPSTRGRTTVFSKDSAAPLYAVSRGFPSWDTTRNVVLSNDGEVIFDLLPWGAIETKDELKSITVYKHGVLVRSYTESEVTGCDKTKEHCSLLYSNDEVIDRDRSHSGTLQFSRVFKDGVSEQEKFLYDYPFFAYDNAFYLIDSRKQVYTFDLPDGELIGSSHFDAVFETLKPLGRKTRVESERFPSPTYLDFPPLKGGGSTQEALAKAIDMKTADFMEKKDGQYRLYTFRIDAMVSRDGSVEIEKIDFRDDAILPRDVVRAFFSTHTFDLSRVPLVFDKWKVDAYFSFRNKNDGVARREKKAADIEERKAYETRLTLETINGVYVPRDLGECMVELDKLLADIDRQDMRGLPNAQGMGKYHFNLGMWIRNNWGLWGGSRLQQYFIRRSVQHPDDMSGVILEGYYDWLNGKKDAWKDWEKAHPFKSAERRTNPFECHCWR